MEISANKSTTLVPAWNDTAVGLMWLESGNWTIRVEVEEGEEGVLGDVGGDAESGEIDKRELGEIPGIWWGDLKGFAYC